MKIKLLYCQSIVPQRATSGSAAFDCFTIEPGVIYPGDRLKVSLGFSMKVPRHHAALLIPRSGLGSKGIILANSVGLIDEDYQKEVFAVIYNTSNEIFKFSLGDRICQMLIIQVPPIEIELVEELIDNGRDGFGSTGK